MDKLFQINALALVFFLYLFECNSDEISTDEDPSGFECKSGQLVDLTNRCDGANDCSDFSDEQDCASAIILFFSRCSEHRDQEHDYYDVYSSEGHGGPMECDLMGTFLQNHKKFKVHSTEYLSEVTFLTANGRHVYFSQKYLEERSPYHDYYHHRGRRVYRITGQSVIKIRRNGLNLSKILDLKGVMDVQMGVDYITTNVYMLMTGTPVRVCTADGNLCTKLDSKFMKNTISFTLSSKSTTLFWIEKRSELNFAIISSLMDGSGATVLHRKLSPSTFLTIDTITERLYWIENHTNFNVISSSKVDGTDKKIVVNHLSNVSSIAIHDNMLYWADLSANDIKFCNTSSDCAVLNYPVAEGIKKYVGKRIMIYQQPVFKKENKNPCNNTVCSDLCLRATSFDFSCSCNQSGISVLSANKMYCENTTLLAAYGNDLYTIGNFFSDSRTVRKTALNSIGSVSAITYDSLNGHVILAETGQQNIYMFHPRDRTLKLIVSDGPGTITSLEYDRFGNNVYWINPVVHNINAISLTTLKTVVILKGKHSYVPYDFTLAPQEKYLFVSFFKSNLSSTVVRMSMDGVSDGEIIHEDTDAHNIGDVVLHYSQSMRILFLFDKETDDIKEYRMDHFDRFQFYDFKRINNNKFGGSCTSLGDRIVWAEQSGGVSWVKYDQSSDSQPSFSFSNLPKLENGETLRITGAIQIKNINSSCFAANGDLRCQHLCLASKERPFTCACADGFTLVDSYSCQKIQHNAKAAKEAQRSPLDIGTPTPAGLEVRKTTYFTRSITAKETSKEQPTSSTIRTDRILSSPSKSSTSSVETIRKAQLIKQQEYENSPLTTSVQNNSPIFQNLIIFGLGLIMGITLFYGHQVYSKNKRRGSLEFGTTPISMNKLVNCDEDVPTTIHNA